MTHDHGGPHDHAHSPQHSQQHGPLADASVRLARPADAPAVGLVQAEVFAEALRGRAPQEVVEAMEPQVFARGWQEALAAPPSGAHRLLVALAGAQVAGFAAVAPASSPDADRDEQGRVTTGEITVMGVHPHGRRQGHGARLLHACVDTLRGWGHDTVEAWVISDDTASRQFLERSGFAPDAAWRDRQVGPEDGDLLREVRLIADIRPDAP